MKTSSKWILGIGIALIVVLALVIIAALAINNWSSLDWAYGVRVGRLWDGDQIFPSRVIPIRPEMGFQEPLFYSNFPWGIAGIIGLFCLCPVLLVVLLVVGLVAVLRRPTRKTPPPSPPPPLSPQAEGLEQDEGKSEIEREPTTPGGINAQPQKGVEASSTCSYCGREVQADWSHCPYCGAALGE